MKCNFCKNNSGTTFIGLGDVAFGKGYIKGENLQCRFYC